MGGAILFWLALFTLAVFVAMAGVLAFAAPRIRRLRDVPPLADDEMPSISIVVAARDEARGIEPALRSLLALDAPRLEIVVVDDRSTDGTGAILDRVAAEDARLRVVHVAELPPGWLGKNHALQLGAERAGGELLLFTDADVVMAPDTLRRATAYLASNRLDHLAAGPRVDMPGWLLRTFGVSFGISFFLFARPWKVSDPASGAHIGVGAFNLLRADAYRRIGTHRAIAMRPDDDMKLGKRVKQHGLRQDFINAAEHVRVDWYHSVREAVRGLRKNAFAAFEYHASLAVLATLAHTVLFIVPFVAVFVTHGPARLLNLATIVIILALFARAAREQRVPAWYGVASPLANALFVFVIWNSMLYTLRHRGIEWRGTHYPLDELRANRV